MTIERVQESESVTGRTRHDILALDKSADKPGLVPHQIQPAGQMRQLLDDSGFSVGLQVGNYVAWLKATREIQHSACRRRASGNVNAPWRDAQHLIVEPSVQHRLAEPPLIPDFDSGQLSLGYQFEHRSLVEVQVIGKLANGHQPICRFAGVFRRFTDYVCHWCKTT